MNVKKFIPDKEFIIGVMIVLAGIVLVASFLPQNTFVQTVRSYLGLTPRAIGTTTTASVYA
jgi:hypothetical protein